MDERWRWRNRYGERFFLETWYPFLLLLNKDFYSPSFSIQWFRGTDSTPGCLGEHVSSSQSEISVPLAMVILFIGGWLTRFGSVTYKLRTLAYML